MEQNNISIRTEAFFSKYWNYRNEIFEIIHSILESNYNVSEKKNIQDIINEEDIEKKYL